MRSGRSSTRAALSFHRLCHTVWKLAGVSLHTKLQVLSATVMPFPLYAYETCDSFKGTWTSQILERSFKNLDTVSLVSTSRKRGSIGWLSHRMPKQLLFGRIGGDTWARQGIEKRWADMVQQDVELIGLDKEWY